MTIDIRCACGKQLQAPETAAGKRVRCPSCRAAIVVLKPNEGFEIVADEVELPEPQVADDDPEAEDEKPQRKRKRNPFPRAVRGRARLGVTLLLAEALMSLLGYAMVFAAEALISIGSTDGSGLLRFGAVTALGGAGLALLAILVGMVGLILGLTVPEREARRSIVVSVVCRILVLALVSIRQVGDFERRSRIFFEVGEALFGVIAFVTLMLYLRRLAELVRSHGVADEADGLMMLGITYYTLSALSGTFMLLPCVGCFAAIGFLVVAIKFVVQYIKFLDYLRNALSD